MSEMPIETRAAVVPVGVNFPKRIIEAVVMPYETETQVYHRGRLVREVIARGAFEGIDAVQRRILVNRDHRMETEYLLGRVATLHPSRDEGLVAELRITKTPHGDDVLTQADEGDLGVSAGFGVMNGGESWPERGLRRLTKLWLDHVAVTPIPAYQDARVLAVRNTPESPQEPLSRVATPNLDKVRGLMLSDRYAMIG